ncbi:MAG: glutamine-hydrolyzing GMP synthase, partial [Phycisphaerae bacterium]|nr:glutamine-hydrolyzing GMP synthase [Phycisphaerae bacterium]
MPSSDPHDEAVYVLDFGSQTAQLIARRLREAGVLALLERPDIPATELARRRPKGIVLSGGPASVYEPNAPRCDPEIFNLGIPILGICYGMQIACHTLGSRIAPGPKREFGRATLHINDRPAIFKGIPDNSTVWMSHGDHVDKIDRDFETLARTPTVPHAAVRHRSKPFHGLLFHPELTHTPHGADILRNWLYEVCRCRGTW